jgi:hypothetical protein
MKTYQVTLRQHYYQDRVVEVQAEDDVDASIAAESGEGKVVLEADLEQGSLDTMSIKAVNP